MAAQGTFIVIEGADSAVTDKQFQLAASWLQQQGYATVTLEFPRHSHPSGYHVKRYLDGDYGASGQISPYAGSLFYALDHHDASVTVRTALDKGLVVLVRHFTAANMAAQADRFQDPNERRGFYVWLDNLEFEVLRLPRPDLNIVLQTSASHQSPHAAKEAIFDELCQLFPKDFTRIDAVRSDSLLDQHSLSAILVEKIRPYLPKTPGNDSPSLVTLAPNQLNWHLPYDQRQAKPTSTQRNYFIPDSLDEATKKVYVQAIDEALARQTKLCDDLIKAGLEKAEALALSTRTLPLAVMGEAATTVMARSPDADHASQAGEHLPAGHTVQPSRPLDLIEAAPRNEFDVLPAALYASSDLPMRALGDAVYDWPYERKARLLGSTYASKEVRETVLATIRYTWEINDSVAAFQQLLTSCGRHQLSWQTLTPRYGYDVPQAIEEAGLTEAYEDCFDSSLQLYSLLQQNGYAHQAQLAALAGHKMRWTLQLSALQCVNLLADQERLNDIQGITEAIRQKLHEVHPLLADSLLT